GGNSPLRRMLPRNFHRLNPVGNAVLALLIEVNSLGNSFSFLFRDAVLEHQRRNPSVLQPLSDLSGFMLDGQRNAGSARSHDNAGPRSLGFFRQVEGESRRNHVKQHFTQGRVVRRLFRLSPTLGTGSDSGPDVQRLRVAAGSEYA